MVHPPKITFRDFEKVRQAGCLACLAALLAGKYCWFVPLFACNRFGSEHLSLPMSSRGVCLCSSLCSLHHHCPSSTPCLQSLLRARPTVSPDEMKSYEKFTAEFGEEG